MLAWLPSGHFWHGEGTAAASQCSTQPGDSGRRCYQIQVDCDAPNVRRCNGPRKFPGAKTISALGRAARDALVLLRAFGHPRLRSDAPKSSRLHQQTSTRSPATNAVSMRQMVPPWALALLCASKRLHSIFLLRLFNDGLAMGVAYVALATLAAARPVLAVTLFSAAVSVKMNVLLRAPPVLLVLLKVCAH